MLKTSKHFHKIKEHNVVLISSMYFPRYLPWVKSKYRCSKTNTGVQTNWFKIEFCPCLYAYLLLTRSTFHVQKRLRKIQTLFINGRRSGMQEAHRVNNSVNASIALIRYLLNSACSKPRARS